MKQLKVILIGAGVVKEMYQLSDEMCFEDWRETLTKPKFADAVIIATQGKEHFAPAGAALRAGYDLLLEKPAATTPEECLAISDLANKLNRKVIVCHVLRYPPFFGVQGRMAKG